MVSHYNSPNDEESRTKLKRLRQQRRFQQNFHRNANAGGGGKLPDLILVDSAGSGVDGASFTFANRSLGAASTTRNTIIAGTFRAGTAVTIVSLTIGGLAATVDIESRNTTAGVTSAYIAHCDTSSLGTNADIVLTLSGTTARAAVSVYRNTKFNGAAPTKVGQGTRGASDGSMSADLTSPDLGFQVGVAYHAGTGATAQRHSSASKKGQQASISIAITGDADVWSGLVENIDFSEENSAGTSVMAIASAGWKYP